jgi:GntR family transcriptional regulator
VEIRVTPADGLPIYQQIVNQVRYFVASGRLAPGEELPPIRVLAERLLINPNTVARAYRELEVAGIVTKRSTAGTFVTDRGVGLNPSERLKLITPKIDALLAEANGLGLDLTTLIEYLKSRSIPNDESSSQHSSNRS